MSFLAESDTVMMWENVLETILCILRNECQRRYFSFFQ